MLDYLEKINLLDYSRENLKKFFLSIGAKSFNAKQIMYWIYHRYCDDFNQMSNINKNLRNKLKSLAKVCAPKIVDAKYSNDGTIKWILKINDQYIETIYIPEKSRVTLCISSQIGCALKCTFCATGNQGFNRNLRVSEIIGQVWCISKNISFSKKNNLRPITNIVFMGMGEPLLNLKNVISAIKLLMDDFGFNISKKRIILSTSGIIPALVNLIDKIDVSLAISLHAPNDIIRNKIMPINKKYNINSLLAVVRKYIAVSKANKGWVMIEYVMLNKINDKDEHAHQLAQCLKYTPCKINIIHWNTFPEAIYTRSSDSKVENFINILKNYGFITTLRKTRGDDINASCGQLTSAIANHKLHLKNNIT